MLIVLMLVVVISVSLVVAVGCEKEEAPDTTDNNIHGGENNPADNVDADGDKTTYTYTVTFNVTVRDAYFAEVGSRNLLYAGNIVCPVEDGVFEASVEVGDEGFDKTKLSTDRSGCTFVITETRDSVTEYEDFNKIIYTIIEVEDGKACDGFIDLGGKVVLHSDGETRVSGATLYIDGNVAIADARGDFNLNFIPVGAEFSAKYPGYETVDVAQNKLEYYLVAEDVYVYTFRLQPING